MPFTKPVETEVHHEMYVGGNVQTSPCSNTSPTDNQSWDRNDAQLGKTSCAHISDQDRYSWQTGAVTLEASDS